jgi:hypothetical protein
VGVFVWSASAQDIEVTPQMLKSLEENNAARECPETRLLGGARLVVLSIPSPSGERARE